MKKLVKRLLMIIGGITVLMFVLSVGVSVWLWVGEAEVPGKTILEADFEQGLVEHYSNDPAANAMLAGFTRVRDVVEALEVASEDDRVAALVARVGVTEMGLAQIQELRDAVSAFRRKGKTAVAYAETFGEGTPGNGAYYLATAFDQIYVQPSGDVGLTGLVIETPFVRGTLEKLGMTPRLDQRCEYKNAMNIFTEREYTDPHREATQRIMDSMFGQMVQGIAETRGLSEDEVRSLIDRGPFFGREAVDAKLVDGLAYRDEVYATVKKEAGQGAELLYLSRYLDRAGRPHTKGETVALIYGVGTVHRGATGYDPTYGSPSMGSESLAAAFRAAIEDGDVKAILFRVDSPGGSYVASDTVWRETVRAKEAGKPVIVSMGDVAGSGGYFVAMAADKIVAQPGTITGSIGVVSGKMLTSGFWDKVGVSWDEVHTSANAAVWSGTQDFTPEQWARFQLLLDRVYDDFTSKVAQGRGLALEKVREIAKGRVWTGEDAKALGLVDELGGFPEAIRLVKQALGVPEDEPIRLKVFPEEKSLLDMGLEMLWEEGPDSSEEHVTAAAQAPGLRELRPFLRRARQLGLAGNPGILSMPDMEPKW